MKGTRCRSRNLVEKPPEKQRPQMHVGRAPGCWQVTLLVPKSGIAVVTGQVPCKEDHRSCTSGEEERVQRQRDPTKGR